MIFERNWELDPSKYTCMYSLVDFCSVTAINALVLVSLMVREVLMFLLYYHPFAPLLLQYVPWVGKLMGNKQGGRETAQSALYDKNIS